MKNKILITSVALGCLVFALFPIIKNNNNNIVVNAQLDDNISFMPDINISSRYFTKMGDNAYKYNYSESSKIYLKPKFNYLDKDLLNYFDSPFSLGGYYESEVDSDFYGELFVDVDNNEIYFYDSDNGYFIDGVWTLYNNVIWTDSNDLFTENIAKFIEANFDLSFTYNFTDMVNVNTILNINQNYYFNNDFLLDSDYYLYLTDLINVSGTFSDGTTFDQLKLEEYELYALVNNEYVNINDLELYKYFVLNSVGSTPIYDGTASFINRTFTRVDTMPFKIGGWFTFNDQPFNNTTNYFTFNRDIYFTSNNISYNNILVTYDNIMNVQVGSIYYRIKNNDGSYARTDLIYSYQATPFYSKWENINNRQIYFDNFTITPQEYNFMRSIGTFTFISNKEPNSNDYTLTDLFWGIADIPYITLRNLMSIELFDSNLYIAFTSVISVVLAIFILRKII